MSTHNSALEESFEGTRYLHALHEDDFGGPPKPAGELVGFFATHVISHEWTSADGEHSIQGDRIPEQFDIAGFMFDTAKALGLPVSEVKQQTQEYLQAVDPAIAKELGDYWQEAA
jgi:hypothetical protein